MKQDFSNEVTEKKRLRHRIRRLYGLLNERKFDKCFEIVDPRLREAGKIEFEAYERSLSHFIQKHGLINVARVEQLKLFVDLAATNEDRDFAYALVVAEDKNGKQMELRERWVKDADGLWYTRKLGLV